MDESRSVIFHVDKDVLPADELKSCIVDFYDLLKEAASDCMSDIKWLASIEKGSVALAAYPVSETETEEEIDSWLASMRNDFELIRGGKEPSSFTNQTVERYQRLARTFSKKGKMTGDPTIKILSPAFPASAPIPIRESKISFSKQTQTSFGSATGVVKSISAVKEKYLALYEEATGRRIKVIYDSDMIECVRESFENQVTVIGEVVYSPEGFKREIKATRIELSEENQKKNVRFTDLFGVLAGEAR